MNAQDLSQNRRIASLMTLTRELEHSRTPEQTMQMLKRGFADAYGFVASMLLSTRGLPRDQYRVVQLHLEDGILNDYAEQVPDEAGPVLSGGIVASIIGQCEPQLIQDVDWTSDPYFHQ